MKTWRTPGAASAADTSIAADGRPRERAADEEGVQHRPPVDVVDERAVPGEQPRVLDPFDAGTDETRHATVVSAGLLTRSGPTGRRRPG